MKQVKAIASITNTYGLALYDTATDEVLVGVNDKAPEWVAVEWDDEGEPYIEYYGGRTYLDEFVLVNLTEEE